MNQQGFISILLIIIVVAFVGTGIYVVSTRQTSPPVPAPVPTPKPSPTPIDCTMEAKQCPDGSYVSRTGSNCEFTKCPAITPASNGEKIIKKVGEQESSFLIQKINPDSVDGLWFQTYPIERPNDPGTPKIIRVGDDIGYVCEGVSIKLISINFSGQTITFNKVIGKPPYGGCPICLAGNSLIGTPSGLIAVKDLQVGMSVWTTDKTNQRVSGVITKTSKVLVPPTHQMINLILNDGRELFVSPGHPTIDGRAVSNFAAGDLYDGISVVSAERVSYGESATYDILPSGDTGFYWANGILIGSTLR